jgi:hypothetical protein
MNGISKCGPYSTGQYSPAPRKYESLGAKASDFSPCLQKLKKGGATVGWSAVTGLELPKTNNYVRKLNVGTCDRQISYSDFLFSISRFITVNLSILHHIFFPCQFSFAKI